MLLIDEIRGRLAEVFSLKDHKIDHVVHGAMLAVSGSPTVHARTTNLEPVAEDV